MVVPVGDVTPAVSLDMFSTYLNNPNLDSDRATLILTLATSLCESIVSPLPDGSQAVILDVAERAYANPTSVGGADLGLYAEGVGPYSQSTPGTVGGGLWLTDNNKSTLRRLASGGGVFSADLTPAAAAQSLPWWDTGSSWNGW